MSYVLMVLGGFMIAAPGTQADRYIGITIAVVGFLMWLRSWKAT